MTNRHILVVEDDKHISKLLVYNLNKDGFECTPAKTGEAAMEIMGKDKIDLILLDIMLPGIDGWEVCRRVRHDDKLKHIPIIIVTAKGEETDRVVGFELGADDYVVKPFSVRELALRIRSLFRKRDPQADSPADRIRIGDIDIDIQRHRVNVGEKQVKLTNKEFDLLVTLIRRQGRVQSREILLESIWEYKSGIMTRTVDTHVKRLRQKLNGSGRLIETVRGVGYRFTDEED